VRTFCILLAAAAAALTFSAAPSFAGTIHVNTTADENGPGSGCSLREAVWSASVGNFGGCTGFDGGPTTVDVPAGSYLVSDAQGPILVSPFGGALTITIAGAGSASTTVHQTLPNQSVFRFGVPGVPGQLIDATFSGMTISGGSASGGGISAATTQNITLDHVALTANNCGSGPFGRAGGILFEALGLNTLIIKDSTFTNNVCAGPGGAILADANAAVTITDSTFTGNSSGTSLAGSGGGALRLEGNPGIYSPTATVEGSVFRQNQALGGLIGGGAISVTDGTVHLGPTEANRFLGNQATDSASGAVLAGSGATVDAQDNWWGCNGGPTSGVGCDRARAAAGGSLQVAPWIVLTNAASPNPITIAQSTTLTADFLHDSASGSVPLSRIGVLLGLPVTWGNVVKGSLSGAQTSIQANGTATATFTPNALGTGGADATVDNATATGSVTINQAAPAVSSSASPSSLVLGSGSIKDTATLSGGFNAGGTLTFRLYGPNDASCAGAVLATDVHTVFGDGSFDSTPFTPSASGTYRWTVSYSGDENNSPATSACNAANESIVVSKASPTLVTAASAGVALGGSVHDTATLAGGFSPKGTITFRLYGPNDTSCGGPPPFTDVKSISDNGTYVSGGFAPTTVGVYRWTATYSGDGDNDMAASGCNAADESVTVEPAVPGSPLNVSAVAGDGSVTVSFSPPVSDGGAAITSYTATCGGMQATGPGSPITISGLTNGLSYACTVRATNSAGTGPPSTASNAVTPGNACGPVIFGFTPSSGSLKTLVKITGLRLVSTTKVTFNGAPAVFKQGPSGELYAIVPAAATTGPIVVTNPCGSTQSIGTFTVINTSSIGPTLADGVRSTAAEVAWVATDER
jgi:CSLREA domain-containing protein